MMTHHLALVDRLVQLFGRLVGCVVGWLVCLFGRLVACWFVAQVGLPSYFACVFEQQQILRRFLAAVSLSSFLREKWRHTRPPPTSFFETRRTDVSPAIDLLL